MGTSHWTSCCSPSTLSNDAVEPAFLFSPPSQLFCTRFTAAICPWGSACNKKHEPHAEACCADFVCHGCCQAPNCQFHHREPEGEPLSFLSRTITFEEFKKAIQLRRRVYYFGEQGLTWSGHWRLNGDDYTFRSGLPNMYINCGLTCRIRTKGIPWTKSSKNNKRALRFQEQQTR